MRWQCVALLLLGAGVVPARHAPAQASARPAPQSSVSGRVLLAVPGEDPRPVVGVWVALNRVGNDSAGVIDSVRSGSDGAYRMTFRRGGDPEAIYFTDVSFGGVAYFTDPLRALTVTGDEADLIVFDTISARPGRSMLTMRGRHFVVGPRTTDGRRPIVEVFELTNDTSLTITPRGGSEPVWTIALVEGARDPEVGDGDVVESVVRFREGRAELVAPWAPGLRQLSIRYTIPERAFPLSLRLEAAPEVFEVLIAGTDGTATGAGLHPEAAVNIDGQPYARFLSQRVSAGAVAGIRAGRAAVDRYTVPVGAGATVLVLAGALVYARRSRYPSVDN